MFHETSPRETKLRAHNFQVSVNCNCVGMIGSAQLAGFNVA